MLTQGMKRWLQSLFAWWPWKRADAADIDYTPASGSLKQGTTQVSPFRTVIDGSLSRPTRPARPVLPTITTISIEPTEDDERTVWPSFENTDHTDYTDYIDHTTSLTSLPFVPVSEDEDRDSDSIFLSELYDNHLAHTRQEDRKTQELSSQQERQESLTGFAPATQQRLEFLRYLVQRGIISDDIK